MTDIVTTLPCGNQRQVRAGAFLWPASKRWNSLSLDHSGRRWEIPDEIIELAKTEPCKPAWWTQPRKCRIPILAYAVRSSQSGGCRIYTAAEREAFVRSRPDLLLPWETRKDRQWWAKHREGCAYWAIHDSFRGHVFDRSRPLHKPGDKSRAAKRARENAERFRKPRNNVVLFWRKPSFQERRAAA
jgi:hypothetical protein